MPNFQTELPEPGKHMGFDLVRTPRNSPLRGIVTSDNFIVCDTHYYHGRTAPCERRQTDHNGEIIAGNCAACNDAQPFRTHVYVSAFDPRTHDHFLYECTAHAAKAFADYRATAGTLRGCAFSATRPKGTANGKVVIETTTANLSRVTLPEAPNIIRALCVIWRLPAPEKRLTHSGYSSATMQRDEKITGDGIIPASERLKRQRDPFDSDAEQRDIDQRRRELLAGLQPAPNGNGQQPPQPATP